MKEIRLNAVFLVLLVLASGCTVARFFKWNFANIDDHKRFTNAPVANSTEDIYSFKAKEDSIIFPKLVIKKEKYPFEEGLDKSKTVAFLIIRNDTIIYEKYFNKYSEDSWVNSFSMAKSFVSTLVGIAIDEGHIQSVDDPIGRYVPQLGEAYGAVSIRHILEMRSGVKYKEAYYSPFSDAAVDYYGKNIKKRFSKFDLEIDPDTKFQYRSVNTQVLAEAVENATGMKISDYLEERIWKPLGMEYPASWSIDNKKDSTMKAFCCLNATARDFAKFGLLFLNEGRWNGQQIVPQEWVRKATTYDRAKNGFRYTYQWWNNVSYDSIGNSEFDVTQLHDTITWRDQDYYRYPDEDFMANGHLGQYIYVNPKHKVVIVRLGEKPGKITPGWGSYMQWIARRNGVDPIPVEE
ncbi:MAG: serine hydrolase [Bacteroidota bacterium]